MRVVISQPMYFPWPGHMEQLAAADVYVFYDDVQFTPRNFFHRVQIRNGNESAWLSVPLRDRSQRALIRNLRLASLEETAANHTRLFAQHYSRAPFRDDAVQLMRDVFSHESQTLDQLCEYSTRGLCDYLGLASHSYARSSLLDIEGSSSDRLLAICRHFGASEYLTGHGAANYLDHAAFDAAGIQVMYADYSLTAYPQLGEDFTPYVSTLDMIAMMGPRAGSCIRPKMVPWQEFVVRSEQEKAKQ